MPQPYPHGELVVVIDRSDLDRNECCVLQPPAGPVSPRRLQESAITP
jgi:hypothetical protein